MLKERKSGMWRPCAWLVTGLVTLGSAGQAITCASPGKDGVGTNITGIVNTYYPGTVSASAGGMTLSLGASTGASTQITAGDLLLVMQMQDATLNTADSTAYGSGGTSGSGATAVNAGKYEYVVATSASSGNGSVSIRGDGSGGGLINSYTNSAYSATSGAKRFQVIRVPQYSSATLGATAITAPAWNGSTGGVVGIDVAGTLNLNGGSITTTGLGFRGGVGRQLTGDVNGSAIAFRSPAPANGTVGFHGQKGEGIAGTPRYVLSGGVASDTGAEGYPNGSSARGAPGNAGGGGTDSSPSNNFNNSGGGGGAGGGAGGTGGNAWANAAAVGGRGGTAAPNSVSQLVLGGGGGAGSTNDGTGDLANGLASSGAAGGGAVLVRAGTVTGTGGIFANGASANNTVVNDGSGGGGAGGSIMVVSPNALPGTLSVTATGGNGGSNTGGGNPRQHGPGGGGGGGFVVLSSPASVSVAGGTGGTTRDINNLSDTFGATNGAAGAAQTAAAVTSVPGASATTTCFPNLVVTKTTSTPSRFSATDTAATYTITVNNTGGTASGVALSDVLPTPFTYGATTATTYSGGASGPASLGATGTTTAGFGTPGGTPTNSVTLPQGGSLSVTFTVNLNSAVPGIYQNPAAVSFTDPTRTVTQTVTPGGAYTVGGTVGGSNYASGSSTNEDVAITGPPLACTNNFYALVTDGTSSYRTIAPLTPAGTVQTTIATVPLGTANNNAALAVSADGTKLFVATADGVLQIYDVPTGKWLSSVAIPGNVRTLRMAVTKPTAANPNGVGYFSIDTRLWTFQTTAPYAISGPITLNYADTSGLIPAPTISGSGDFFADSAGNLFLSVNNGSSGSYLDTFLVRPNGSVLFLGRLNDSNIGTSDTYGGYAAIGQTIYASSSDGRIIAVDLATLTVTQTAAASAARGSTDLASCSYPTLNPVIGVTKTAAKVAGSAGSLILPGDTLEYTIIVRNSGNISAAEATLQDSIPAGATYVAGSTKLNMATVADVNGTMPFATPGVIKSPNAANGVLQADSTPTVTTDREATLTFRVTINAGTSSVSNQATATYSDNSTGSAATTSVLSDDPNTLASNDPTVTDTAKPILAVTKTVDRTVALYPNSVNGAEPVPPVLNYTITVTNNGTLAAAGVTLTDVLPANVGTPTVTENGNPVAATQNGQNLTWSVGTLATGSAATRTFRVTVTAPPAPTLRATQPQSALVNSVVASATNAATTPAATATTGTAYTALFKQVHNIGSSPAAAPIPATSPAWSSTGTGLPRNVVEYCIDFTNYGSLPLNNYKINDVVPANTTLVAGSLFVKQGNMQVTPSTAYVGATTGVTDGTVTATDGTVTATKTVTATIGTLAINTTGSFCFRATIN